MTATRFSLTHYSTRYSGLITHVGSWLTSSCSDITYNCSAPIKQPDQKQDTHLQPITIYCIHGTADRSSAFSRIAKQILNKLPPEITKIHLVSFNGRGQLKGIDFFAQQLKDKILANKDKRVILIGHSRGCIVASYFTENLAKQNGVEVEGTINICGPFGGSTLAIPPFTLSTSVDQMRVGSPFLKDLTEKMKTSDNTYYYLSAKHDSLVTAEQAFVEEHKQNTYELDKHGHLSIMGSQRIAEHIIRIINSLLEKKFILDTLEKALSEPLFEHFNKSHFS